jgi:serine/threonine protein kinase
VTSETDLAGQHHQLPIGTRISEFEVKGVVGEGGFSTVYLAFDHSLLRTVALKEYLPTALAQRAGSTQVVVRSERHRETFEAGMRSFINEARLLAQFDHPALVKVYRFWEANSTAYLVMPYYEGTNLRQVVRDDPQRVDEHYLRNMLGPLMDALEHLHDGQIFHRDIAPDNILILNTGQPVLLDFGAARRVISDMTQALTVILKPGFAPIEQYADDPSMKQGSWTDVYALCAVLYYAMLRKAPPAAVTRMIKDNLQPLINDETLTHFDRDFLSAIDAGLAVVPENRVQSIADLRFRMGMRTYIRPSGASTSTVRASGGVDLPIARTGTRTGARDADAGGAVPRTVPVTTGASKAAQMSTGLPRPSATQLAQPIPRTVPQTVAKTLAKTQAYLPDLNPDTNFDRFAQQEQSAASSPPEAADDADQATVMFDASALARMAKQNAAAKPANDPQETVVLTPEAMRQLTGTTPASPPMSLPTTAAAAVSGAAAAHAGAVPEKPLSGNIETAGVKPAVQAGKPGDSNSAKSPSISAPKPAVPQDEPRIQKNGVAAKPEIAKKPAVSNPGKKPPAVALVAGLAAVLVLGTLAWVVIRGFGSKPAVVTAPVTQPAAQVADAAAAPAVIPPVPPPAAPESATITVPNPVVTPPPAELPPATPEQVAWEALPKPSKQADLEAFLKQFPSGQRAAEAKKALEEAVRQSTGRLILTVKPWGNVTINGEDRGTSPPVKNLNLPEGKYEVKIENPGGPPLVTQIEIKNGQTRRLEHTFR